MTLPRVLVLILAGGAGGRLELLTDHRAKPAVPFAGVYRLVDFPLSNCQHAQLPDVWVSAQFHPVSLAEAARYGVVQLDGGRVCRYDYKPDRPPSGTVSNEVFVPGSCPAPR